MDGSYRSGDRTFIFLWQLEMAQLRLGGMKV